MVAKRIGAKSVIAEGPLTDPQQSFNAAAVLAGCGRVQPITS
jgi:hypothetical protein